MRPMSCGGAHLQRVVRPHALGSCARVLLLLVARGERAEEGHELRLAAAAARRRPSLTLGSVAEHGGFAVELGRELRERSLAGLHASVRFFPPAPPHGRLALQAPTGSALTH